MESPVIIQKCTNFATPVDPDETGFPFDDNDDSHDHFQSRLNDIAQRHPEFANHLRFDDFPSLRRKRYGSGSSSTDQDEVRHQSPGQGPSSSSSHQFSPDSRSRFADHSFPSGFNRFPFNRRFEEEFASEPRREEKPPEVPKTTNNHHEKRGRKTNPYLPQHLSNTVDLGQKQPPVEETRSQRSMSAPPENRTTQSSTSRVENEQPTANQQYHHQQHPQQHHPEDPVMGKVFSRTTPAREQTPTQQPKERIIPIQVEGRDEPVMPKNPNIQPSGSTEKVFSGERVSPGFAGTFPRATDRFPRDEFYQFMPQGSPNKQQTPPTYQGQSQPYMKQSQHYPQQQQPSHYQQQQQQQPPHHHHHHTQQQQAPPTTHQQEPHPKSKPHPQQQQQHQQQQQQQQFVPPPPPFSNDPLEKIKSVRNDVMELMSHVEKFRGTRKDREYLYLDEMLTRNLIKLDDVETEGKENIRLARKEAIKCIQTCISNLEARAQAMEQETRAAAEAGDQKRAPEQTAGAAAAAASDAHSGGIVQAEPNSGLIQAEQQHAAENQEPEKFKSQATLIIGGVAKAGADTTGETPKVEEEKKPEAVIAAEPMDVDLSLNQEQNVTESAPEIATTVQVEETPATDSAQPALAEATANLPQQAEITPSNTPSQNVQPTQK